MTAPGRPDRVAPATKAARHAQIAAILSEAGAPVRSQEELADRLAERGIRVTQATLSRDLEELGAVKLRGPDGTPGYALPPGSGPAGAAGPAVPSGLAGLAPLIGREVPPGRLASGPVAALARAAADLLLSAEASGNLVIARTPPGAAQLLASMIDRAGLRAVLGTVAGDDTVLIVSRDPAGGNELAAGLLRLAERDGRHRAAAPAPR